MTRSKALTMRPAQSAARPAAMSLPETGLIGALLLGAALTLVPLSGFAQSAAPVEAAPTGPTTTVTPAPAEAPVTPTVAATSDAPQAPGVMRAATAPVKDAEGKDMGTVTLAETASGAVQVTLNLTGVPEGVHAVHLHETGQCEAPSFESAGGHLTGGRNHGAHAEGGMHAGDLPNVAAGADGTVKADLFQQGLTMDEVLDDDGTAFVVHADADDYVSQPSGNAGDRIACGVVEAAAS